MLRVQVGCLMPSTVVRLGSLVRAGNRIDIFVQLRRCGLAGCRGVLGPRADVVKVGLIAGHLGIPTLEIGTRMLVALRLEVLLRLGVIRARCCCFGGQCPGGWRLLALIAASSRCFHLEGWRCVLEKELGSKSTLLPKAKRCYSGHHTDNTSYEFWLSFYLFQCPSSES